MTTAQEAQDIVTKTGQAKTDLATVEANITNTDAENGQLRQVLAENNQYNAQAVNEIAALTDAIHQDSLKVKATIGYIERHTARIRTLRAKGMLRLVKGAA